MTHNTYPAPKPRRVKQPKLTVINYERQPEFGNSVQEWEERIFKRVSHFNVIKFGVPGGSQCATIAAFPQALALAHGNKRMLIYCVDTEGRAFCMSWKDYEKFAEMWLSLRQAV